MNTGVAFRYSLVILFPMAAVAWGGMFCGAADPLSRGRELFEKQWEHDDFVDPFLAESKVAHSADEVGDGLGPLYNARSCAACHADGGGADVDHNVTMITLDPRSEVFGPKFNSGEGRRELLALWPGVFASDGSVSLDAVVHEASARPGYDALREKLRQFVPGGIPASWFDSKRRTSPAIAQRPVIAGRNGALDFYLSQRNSPPLFGLGEIDKIKMADLELIAQQQARQRDSTISGRVGVGKFGWRAQTDTLANFVRGACTGELGLSQTAVVQPLDPADWTYVNRGIDVSEDDCSQLTQYVASLPAPLEVVGRQATMLRAGKLQFYRLGCVQCHVEDVKPVTGLYSDLLLHDMGERLQAPSPAPLGTTLASAQRMTIKTFVPRDSPIFGLRSTAGYYGTPPGSYPLPFALERPKRPQFPRGQIDSDIWNPERPEEVRWDALQREWKTPPLWGLADSAPYLHDGRARTIDEAIRWHGGEAEAVQQKYAQMAPSNREKLLAFLETLVAPPRPIF